MFDDLVVIAPLVPMSVGDQFDADIGAVPLHMTVLPTVRVPPDRSAAVTAAVREIAATTAPVSVVAHGRAGFGHAGSVQVTTVESSDELRRLHIRLLQDVCRTGAESAEPAYNGEGYRPHVSDTRDGRMIKPGEQVMITSLAILDCTQPIRRLVDKAPLSG